MRGTARPVIGAHINLGSFYFVGAPVTVGLTFWFKVDFDDFCCRASKLADESNGAPLFTVSQSKSISRQVSHNDGSGSNHGF